VILCNLVTETLDDDADFNVPVDIFAIGFEEIVDLNAGNIVSARFAVCLIIIIAVIQLQLVAPTIMTFASKFHIDQAIFWYTKQHQKSPILP